MAGEESACQHVMSRMVDGLAFWDDVEKEALDRLMRKMAAFMGLRLLTHAVMGNHFHALLEIPDRESWLERFRGEDGEARWWKHLGTFYEKGSLARLRKRVEEAQAAGRVEEARKILQALFRRMCDVSIWAKEVKESYSRWLNRRRNRQGTVWMARFHNVLVENGEALRVMAAYIDLNPVRAGLVERPEEYRWCGLAAAKRGIGSAKEGVARLVSLANGAEVSEAEALETYSNHVAGAAGPEEGAREKEGSVYLRRQRGLSRGMAMGRDVWVETVAACHGEHFGCYRRGRPRRLPGKPETLVLRLDERTG
jgi:REP element-mobilizing transposase RayT